MERREESLPLLIDRKSSELHSCARRQQPVAEVTRGLRDTEKSATEPRRHREFQCSLWLCTSVPLWLRLCASQAVSTFTTACWRPRPRLTSRLDVPMILRCLAERGSSRSPSLQWPSQPCCTRSN